VICNYTNGAPIQSKWKYKSPSSYECHVIVCPVTAQVHCIEKRVHSRHIVFKIELHRYTCKTVWPCRWLQHAGTNSF